MVEEAEDPRTEGVGARGAQPEDHRPVGPPLDHRVLADLLGQAGRFDRVDPQQDVVPLALAGPPGFVGHRVARIEISRQLPAAGRPEVRALFDPVRPEGADGAALTVPADEVPAARPECQRRRRHPSAAAPVVEGHLSVGTQALEERHQRPWRIQRGHRSRFRQPGGAQLQERVPTTRIAEVHAGDGEVEGDLLGRVEMEVGKIEGLGMDAVAELLLALDGLGGHWDPFVAKNPLVTFECLPAGPVIGGIAGHLVGEGIEGERPVRSQEHQHQVGETFETIGLGHRQQRRTAGRPGGP